ncbi:2-oxo acid dehydrogenase subunit E2 [Buchnera aphidicola (Taiwanaphis decaspermi)]|uniref:2-oxo acid dehydrogenase subunit E2 n=1 Tax=Buchnera aphidicola TaxID=9 RepID=UPI0031B828C0
MEKKIYIPDIGLEKAEIIEIFVKKNDLVKKNDSLMIVEGSKTSMEIPSPYSGTIKNIFKKIGDKIKTNSLIMVCKLSNDKKFDINEKKIKKIDNYYLNKKQFIINASPMIRKLARIKNINLNDVNGTGLKGRILKEDLNIYIKKNINNINIDKKIKEIICFKKSKKFKKENTKEILFSSIQKISSQRLHKNYLMVPHVTQFDEVDITDLEKFRKKYNKSISSKKLTLLPFIIKAVSKSLEKYEKFNSSWLNNNKIIIKKYINIGIAVATKNGLVVPVIKDANKKNIKNIFDEIIKIVKLSKKSKLKINQLQGGTFTISNLGGIGGKFFTPIINCPEVAILGVSKSFIKPVWKKDNWIPRVILPLSLSFDHRIIDGIDASIFITYINKILSDIRYIIM